MHHELDYLIWIPAFIGVIIIVFTFIQIVNLKTERLNSKYHFENANWKFIWIKLASGLMFILLSAYVHCDLQLKLEVENTSNSFISQKAHQP